MSKSTFKSGKNSQASVSSNSDLKCSNKQLFLLILSSIKWEMTSKNLFSTWNQYKLFTLRHSQIWKLKILSFMQIVKGKKLWERSKSLKISYYKIYNKRHQKVCKFSWGRCESQNKLRKIQFRRKKFLYWSVTNQESKCHTQSQPHWGPINVR